MALAVVLPRGLTGNTQIAWYIVISHATLTFAARDHSFSLQFDDCQVRRLVAQFHMCLPRMMGLSAQWLTIIMPLKIDMQDLYMIFKLAGLMSYQYPIKSTLVSDIYFSVLIRKPSFSDTPYIYIYIQLYPYFIVSYQVGDVSQKLNL